MRDTRDWNDNEVKEKLAEKKKKVWSCGCETWTENGTFHIKPCSPTCRVLQIAIEESKKRRNAMLPVCEQDLQITQTKNGDWLNGN